MRHGHILGEDNRGIVMDFRGLVNIDTEWDFFSPSCSCEKGARPFRRVGASEPWPSGSSSWARVVTGGPWPTSPPSADGRSPASPTACRARRSWAGRGSDGARAAGAMDAAVVASAMALSTVAPRSSSFSRPRASWSPPWCTRAPCCHAPAVSRRRRGVRGRCAGLVGRGRRQMRHLQRSHREHDCRIGAHAYLSPGVVLCGGVTIEAGASSAPGDRAAEPDGGEGSRSRRRRRGDLGCAAGERVMGVPARPAEAVRDPALLVTEATRSIGEFRRPMVRRPISPMPTGTGGP